MKQVSRTVSDTFPYTVTEYFLFNVSRDVLYVVAVAAVVVVFEIETTF